MDNVKLALEGGEPIRKRPMEYQSIGANLIGSEEMLLVKEVIDSQTLFRHYGPAKPHMVDDFETEIRELITSRYALATSTGSGSYFCALNALNLDPGDEVIIPTYGWITDYSAVVLAGAVPVFASIDESFNLNPEDFKKKITSRTKAVIIIHYQGAASRLDEIVAIAEEYGISVIEDVAQACGCSFKGKKLGKWGDINCFSLQSHKMIVSGDGGFLTTDNQELFERAVRFHDLGMIRTSFEQQLESPVITKPIPGMQWRMNELSGAVALAQIRKLPGIIEKTQKFSAILRKSIKDEFPDLKFRAVLPENDLGIIVAFDLDTADNLEYFKKAYQAEGLVYGPTSYCKTMDKIDVVRSCLEDAEMYNPEDFIKTEEIVNRFAILSILPVYSEADIKEISMGVIKVCRAMKERGRILNA
ncbi:MAG: aminotransferase class V-fold PLP-dependent enzyme [Bacteroidetes bacterium]|nr:aminotransferase class V-fold PLP-dependent enzyme [Bacteroidota bacterium]